MHFSVQHYELPFKLSGIKCRLSFIHSNTYSMKTNQFFFRFERKYCAANRLHFEIESRVTLWRQCVMYPTTQSCVVVSSAIAHRWMRLLTDYECDCMINGWHLMVTQTTPRTCSTQFKILKHFKWVWVLKRSLHKIRNFAVFVSFRFVSAKKWKKYVCWISALFLARDIPGNSMKTLRTLAIDALSILFHLIRLAFNCNRQTQWNHLMR